MRSRAVITLNPVEKDEVLQAIIRHRRLVEPSRKFCFEVVERKLGQANGDLIELDGMELICMAQAIRSYSKEDKYKHERLSQLADRIEEIRVLFHLMHAKRIKKAARAATLTAIQK
ncbi:MAG TPA: hypothetical protein GX525_11985 [Bacilli bacterium]|nr:hypothetical protein [Bacilli bacterium]